jgi:zinc protease
MRRLPFALLLLAVGDATGSDDAPPSFTMTHYRLENGLEVVLQPDPTVTTAVVHVWYHVGSRDEDAGRTGFAHLFEHLMFTGSKHVADGDFDRLLEEAGGWNNGETDADHTAYYEQVPANFVELALWVEADRMAGLWDAVDAKVLRRQRDVVKNERREDYENRPYGMADLEVQAALWPEGHGYHHPIIGSMEDLDAATLDDVEAFWRRWYRPSNATLVICGGIDVEETRALVEKYFGWMPAQEAPRRAVTAVLAPRETPVELESTDRVQVPKVMLAWRAGAPYTDASADLEVASQILGGGEASRLYQRLVFRDRLATEVDVYLADQVMGGELHVEALAREGVDAAALRAAIVEEIAALRDEGPTADEVERARRVIEASRLAGLENIASRAGAIAEWAAYADDPDHLAEELAMLRAVTEASVRASAATWLGADSAVTMTVHPETP